MRQVVCDDSGKVRSGWALMPLRLFLGVTFLYAGLQKLSNPDFFNSASATSIHAQMEGAIHTSPVHGLLSLLLPVASAVGLVIALGEVAVGVGALLGLFTRIAALGGVLLSLGLFLAISFNASPYFTGADIVFLFAWTPLLILGAADAPALDTWLAAAASKATSRRPGRASRAPAGMTVPRRGVLAGMVAGGAVVLSGATALIGRAANSTTTSATGATGASGASGSSGTPTTTSTTAPGTSTTLSGPAPKGTKLGPASEVPVNGSATFTVPGSGDPGLVIQTAADTFHAFDAVCPHAGCTVSYLPSSKVIICPCHGSEFSPDTGAVLTGPSPTGLARVQVIKGANGDLYAV